MGGYAALRWKVQNTCRILANPETWEFYEHTCRSMITLMLTLKPGPNPKPTYPTATG